MTAPINKPITEEQIKAFKGYHAAHAAWGNLHIVLDDENIKDKHIQFCMDECRKKDDLEGYTLSVILMSMSKSQRMKLAKLSKTWPINLAAG